MTEEEILIEQNQPQVPPQVQQKGFLKMNTKPLIAIVIIAILLLVFLLVFFMYPRSVSYKFGNFDLQDSRLTSNGFQSNVIVNNIITNDNYFDIEIKEYNAIMTHPYYSSDFIKNDKLFDKINLKKVKFSN
jgi:uncharacterized membrane protein (DUF106 family)